MDQCHLAIVSASLKQSGIDVRCLVCNFDTLSVEAHTRHLRSKHPYMQDYLDQIKGKKPNETHEQIRLRVKRIKKEDFEILEKNDKNPSLAQKGGSKYEVYIHSKSYGAIEYDLDRAEGDLVWKYVFTEHPQAEFYALQSQPEEKGILSMAYILIRST